MTANNISGALYGLGYLHEFGHGVEKNLLKTRKYYQKSKVKEHIKRIERKIIEEAVLNEEDLSLADEEKSTALHYAAKLPSLQTYVRLLSLGADPTLTDEKGKNPQNILIKRRLKK